MRLTKPSKNECLILAAFANKTDCSKCAISQWQVPFHCNENRTAYLQIE